MNAKPYYLSNFSCIAGMDGLAYVRFFYEDKSRS